MQKSLRVDLLPERGRTFVGTEDGNISSAFTRVSVPQALEVHHGNVSDSHGLVVQACILVYLIFWEMEMSL